MNDKRVYTVIIFSQNLPGVLYRIADLFLRRKINIESLTVSELEEEKMSRFTIVVHVEPATIEKLVKQLYRIIEVIKVYEKTDDELLYLDTAMFKVSAKNNQSRMEIEDITRLSSAKINFVGSDYIVVEKSGTDEDIRNLLSLLKPLGIKESVRSGRIAVLKDGNAPVEKWKS